MPEFTANENSMLSQNKPKKPAKGFVGMNDELAKSREPKSSTEVAAARKKNVEISRAKSPVKKSTRTNSTRDRQGDGEEK